MSKLLLRVLLVLSCVLMLGSAHAREEILDYRIKVDIQADGQIDVIEQITVRAQGEQIRRGLYRDFPTRYRDRAGNNVVVGLEVVGVERDGQPEPWFTERMNNGIRINTGNDDFLPRLPGEYRYTLRYRSTRQLGFFDQHDELYWNAIGTGWIFPIASATVEVRLPQAVPAEQIKVEAYTGPQGARGQDYVASVPSDGLARWTLSRPLAPFEGLTIVVGFPKGVVTAPTQAQQLRWMLQDNLGVLVALAGLAGLLLFCVLRWSAIGRDPRKGVIIARYEPPAGRSPAELRYLRRQGYDMRCLTSDLLVSAVRGQVVIEHEARTFRRDQWKLERRQDGTQHETRTPDTADSLLASLFAGGNAVLELKQTQSSVLQRASQAHAKALKDRLHRTYFNPNSGTASIAYVIAIGSSAAALMVGDGAGAAIIIPAAGLMLLIATLFRRLIKAPTPEGRRLLDEAEGLKLYLGVAERDELKNLQGPGSPPALDAERYQALLPYAVALDVEEAWTRKFTVAVGAATAAAATAAIGWYRGGNVDNLGNLAQAVSSGLSASIASAATPPGSSSGGGGGGSSGGGGGGGGGGGR